MATTAPPPTRTVTLSIDGQEVTVAEGTTIWDAAKQAGEEEGGDPQDPEGGAPSPDPEGGASA